jgi:hypothetical protein
MSFSASEPVFQKRTVCKNKDGYTCMHSDSKQVCFSVSTKVKLGLKEMENTKGNGLNG